jgi:pimeloyl-ACP methyl ester carboxylesterase
MTRSGDLRAAAAALMLMGPWMAQVSEAQGPGPMSGTPAALDPGVQRSYAPIGGGMFAPQGLLYQPTAPGQKSRIGIIVMHSDLNYTTFPACTQLSKRGYRVLCVNKSSPPGASLDRTLSDLKQAVTFLRGRPGITKVVLLGHSGGATLMSAYQYIAENGVQACQGAEKIAKCPGNLAGLPAADGLMLVDSNWGNAEMTLLSLDPAVSADDNGVTLNPDLDNFNAKNGFVAGGDSNYSAAFIQKFQRAAAARERELTQTAQERVAAIEAGKGRYTDDEPFTVAGGSQFQNNNRLFPQDTRLLSHTVKAWPLLHADGSVTTEIVHSVRLPESNTKSPTPSMNQGAVETTVRTFLTNYAIRVSDDFGFDEDSMHGVDWTSTYSSPPGNVQSIHVPLLVMGMTGHYEYLASETIYEKAQSADKALAFVEGASHGYQTCKPCEKVPGQYGDTEKTTYDYIDQWLSKGGRF